jgi:RNase H-like domain found in reverse transcriptase
MKKRFAEEPVLSMPDQLKPFQIESDASKVATGAVLTQLNLNGDRHPVAFLSKTFTETERKYEIYDRELLGIIRALKKWRHYIQGSGHMMVVYSDHKNLTYFRTAQKLNDRQARWSLLSGFDLKLIYLPGTKMVQSDTLSRQPDYGTDKQMEEEDKVVLPDNLFISLLDTELQEWLDTRLRVMSGQSLNQTFDNGSEDHNEFKLWSLPPPFLVRLINQTTLIVQPMDVTTLDANISVLNVEIPHTSNRIALFTPVKPATK